eukprot:CAMPEP_0197542722 /NCGR_PEP_ID=MMETSP1318-20131121/67857_1 /TAXON_ID=552666 /ORGANISM="Partenskyella glossopodia, Strain RCC365" /LENGTH=164 /DNA_ID=CAMNT_0043102007 /DNA_START=549 /DNA_END=1043 /DNA_ORIENTATION=+
MDTVFMPQTLKNKYLSSPRHNSPDLRESNTAWGSPIPGPVELFSRGALRSFGLRHEKECDTGLGESMSIYDEWQQEDMYIYKCLEKLGYRNIEPSQGWRLDFETPESAYRQMQTGEEHICWKERGGEDTCIVRSEVRDRVIALHMHKQLEQMRIVKDWIGRDVA